MSDSEILILSTLAATLRLATPLVLASLAGLFAERSGIIDLGLEGKMLASAFAAAAAAATTQSPWLGLAAAIAVSVAMALLHGFACITHRGDQVVSGVAINILAFGLTGVLGTAWYQQGGNTPGLDAAARFMPLAFPDGSWPQDAPPVVLWILSVLAGHNILVYAALAAVPAAWWLLYRTRFGLRLRAAGENPAVVDTAGISVAFLRYRALLLGAVLCGAAGAYLSIAQNAAFSRDMTAGRGYIALAAMIFGKWRPWPAFFACLLFGFLDAAAIRLQGVALPGLGEVPVQFIQALPYVLTVVLLAGFMGRADAPKAIGRPYVKER